jgi:cytochrome P450
LPRYAYFPFSGGPRACPGSGFALHELMLLVPAIVQQARFTLAPGHAVTLAPTFTLRPGDGLQMRVQRR